MLQSNRFASLALLVALVVAFPALSNGQTGAPAPLIRVPFDEGSGETAANKGTAGGVGQLRTPAAFDANVPAGDLAPKNNVSSMNFGDGTELGGAVKFDIDPTPGLTTLTITAWVFPVTTDIGPGGNRIVSTWPTHNFQGMPGRRTGIDLVWGGNQQIQFAVNQAPDWPQDLYAGPYSGDGTVWADTEWTFVAVTYDTKTEDLEYFPNAEMTPGYKGYDGVVQYYIGYESQEVALDSEHTYDTGPVSDPKGKQLMIGNFTTFVTDAIGQQDRQFRGWIDDVRIYDRVLTLAQIREVQKGVVTAVDSWSFF